MSGQTEPATLDTNVAIYALTDSLKTSAATDVMRRCAFLSVQVLNEYANVAVRKRQRPWREVAEDLDDLTQAVPRILPIDGHAHRGAVRIAARYQLSFYDSLMLAVALSGDARTFYSEDMQHGLVVDGVLEIVDPFRALAR